ncbi:hypothetical protein [Microbacterium sp. GCS4]|uniref:hypothetical protein n=1 Tax=Microbacterium sp. GCS4 TaxID=1692239 RepID=UPI0006A49D7E|nr:hypothetical protein [Microbacterium sp. GCS4]KNY05159.1 hypothetical protein AKH00_12285 [Microbacterium sp. GCS4]
MILISVAVVMFVWGVVVERAGRVLGTVMALLPVLVWFGVLVAIQADGDLGWRVAADHALALIVGLSAFMLGSSVDSIRAAWSRHRGRRAENE